MFTPSFNVKLPLYVPAARRSLSPAAAASIAAWRSSLLFTRWVVCVNTSVSTFPTPAILEAFTLTFTLPPRITFLPLLSVRMMEMLCVPGKAATYQLPALMALSSAFWRVTDFTASAPADAKAGASPEQSTVNSPAIALSELIVTDLRAENSAGTAIRISPQRFLN